MLSFGFRYFRGSLALLAGHCLAVRKGAGGDCEVGNGMSYSGIWGIPLRVPRGTPEDHYTIILLRSIGGQ